MFADYAFARCCAITKTGRRCLGRWRSARPCLFAWDPVTGDGIEGPHIVLCWRHSEIADEVIPTGKRIEVVGGWLGGANQYHYGNSVWAEPTGWARAALWWEHRAPVKFGQLPHRRDAI